MNSLILKNLSDQIDRSTRGGQVVWNFKKELNELINLELFEVTKLTDQLEVDE